MRGLRQGGLDVSVIYADLDYRYGLRGVFRQRKFRVENGIPTFRLDGFGWPKKNQWFLDRWAKAFATLFDDYVSQYGRPDIFHAHSFFGGYVARQLSQKTGIPYIYTEHFTGIMDGSIPKWQQPSYLDVYQNAHQVIGVSRELSRKILLEYGITCVTLPNFIDDKIFFAKKSLVQKPKRFIAVGDLVERKRFDLSIQAMGQLVLDGHSAELVIVGSGPKEKELRQLARSLGCDKQVLFRGRLNYKQVAAEMRASDVFLLTSDVETFGIVLAEAMSCGIPVIATDCYGPKDIVTKETGVIIPKGDSCRLVEAIVKMMDDYSNYAVRIIHDYAVQNFGFDSVIALLKKQYQEVLDS